MAIKHSNWPIDARATQDVSMAIKHSNWSIDARATQDVFAPTRTLLGETSLDY